MVEQAKSLLSTLAGLREARANGSSLTLFVDDGTQAVAQVIRLLDGASVQLGAVSVARPSLDEVFLRATGSRLEGAAANERGQRDGNN